jgi:hypothetical protein
LNPTHEANATRQFPRRTLFGSVANQLLPVLVVGAFGSPSEPPTIWTSRFGKGMVCGGGSCFSAMSRPARVPVPPPNETPAAPVGPAVTSMSYAAQMPMRLVDVPPLVDPGTPVEPPYCGFVAAPVRFVHVGATFVLIPPPKKWQTIAPSVKSVICVVLSGVVVVPESDAESASHGLPVAVQPRKALIRAATAAVVVPRESVGSVASVPVVRFHHSEHCVVVPDAPWNTCAQPDATVIECVWLSRETAQRSRMSLFAMLAGIPMLARLPVAADEPAPAPTKVIDKERPR